MSITDTIFSLNIARQLYINDSNLRLCNK